MNWLTDMLKQLQSIPSKIWAFYINFFKSHPQLTASLISASATAFLTVIALPFSYKINNWLSEPIISIEYAQIISYLDHVSLPMDEIHDIGQSPEYQSYTLKYGGMINSISSYQRSGGVVSGVELNNLIKDIDLFINDISSHI